MLQADKQVLLAGVKRNALELRQRELEFHVERYTNLATQASVVAGFSRREPRRASSRPRARTHSSRPFTLSLARRRWPWPCTSSASPRLRASLATGSRCRARTARSSARCTSSSTTACTSLPPPARLCRPSSARRPHGVDQDGLGRVGRLAHLHHLWLCGRLAHVSDARGLQDPRR